MYVISKSKLDFQDQYIHVNSSFKILQQTWSSLFLLLNQLDLIFIILQIMKKYNDLILI